MMYEGGSFEKLDCTMMIYTLNYRHISFVFIWIIALMGSVIKILGKRRIQSFTVECYHLRYVDVTIVHLYSLFM